MSALKGTRQCWSAALPERHSAGAWHSSLFVIVLFPLSKVSVSGKRLSEAFRGIAIDPRAPKRQHEGGSPCCSRRPALRHDDASTVGGQLLGSDVKGEPGGVQTRHRMRTLGRVLEPRQRGLDSNDGTACFIGGS